MLKSIRRGNKIVATKEFMLVFFITCFVPFIRPNFPIIKESEMNRLKNEERERLKKKRQQMQNQSMPIATDILDIDTSMFEYFRKQKEQIAILR